MTELSEKPKDCLSCKLITGFGLIGSGLHVLNQSRRFENVCKYYMVGLSSCLAILGVVRLFDIPVFASKEDEDEK